MPYQEITTVEAALSAKGFTTAILADMFKSFPEEYRQQKITSFIMDVVEDVLNADAPIDWSNTDQRKWRIWWNIEERTDGSPGFGLSLRGCDYDLSFARVGARRYFASKEIALHAVKYFTSQYEQEFNWNK